MPKFSDYSVTPEITDIMEAVLDTYPDVFPGFDLSMIGTVITKKKRSRRPVRLQTVGYPKDVFCDKVYIVEAFEKDWTELTQKKKNLAVFHVMCSIPEGGFDTTSKHYGKKRKPDYEMYVEEFAASGGVPNWMENDDAKDPMDKGSKKKTSRTPVTSKDVAEVTK